jgi:glyoxylase-like metal-dependent hydrolase (beta-lactamase superfamily II)
MLRITPCCGGFTQTNGYFVESEGGTRLVVDAPEGMAEWLERQGPETRPDALLLTHAHFDHVLDAARIRERFGCPVLAFTEPTPDLTLEAFVRDYGVEVALYAVDRKIADGERFRIGDVGLEALHVPGHSPDSLCFLADVPDEQGRPVLFAGDVLFAGSIGRTDFPNGSHAALIRGIRERLFPLEPETRVLPGHGPETTVGEERRTNPFAGLGE